MMDAASSPFASAPPLRIRTDLSTPRASGHVPTALLETPDTGGTTSANPFKVINASDDDGPKVRVVFGQVNSFTAAIGGTNLDDVPTPLLEITTNGVILLAVELDVDGAVVGASIENHESQPDADATHGYITLATVTIADGAVTAINQSVSFSLACRRCGVSDIHFWGV